MTDIQKTLNERKSKYGDFRGHADLSTNLKQAMRKGDSWHDLQPYMQESLDMIQHKIARILNGDPNYEDSWVDIVGYAQLALDRLKEDNMNIGVKQAFNTTRPEQVAQKVSYPPGTAIYKPEEVLIRSSQQFPGGGSITTTRSVYSATNSPATTAVSEGGVISSITPETRLNKDAW